MQNKPIVHPTPSLPKVVHNEHDPSIAPFVPREYRGGEGSNQGAGNSTMPSVAEGLEDEDSKVGELDGESRVEETLCMEVEQGTGEAHQAESKAHGGLEAAGGASRLGQDPSEEAPGKVCTKSAEGEQGAAAQPSPS